ncbi:MAG: bifunctional diguanylate cyclase/phosphodiesterase [Rhodocyclaceae bacterium]|nr:bifunctional diguanylate cyclase/phosphodiesterase [Rhodocyclaceae bacterium]
MAEHPLPANDIDRCAELCREVMAAEGDSGPVVAAMTAAIGRIAADLLEEEGVAFLLAPAPPAEAAVRIAASHEDTVYGHFTAPGGVDLERLQALARLVGWLLHMRNEELQRENACGACAEALQRQGQILDQISDSVITMDLAGFITGWNKGAERLFGYSAAEAQGRNILFLYADENSEDILFHDAFTDHGAREMEVRRRRKSGEVFWASLSLSLIRDEHNQPTGIIGYLTDITERLAAEEKLHLNARIFEQADEGILITDAEERIVSVNSAFCRITGYEASEVMGQTPRMLKSGHHDAAFYREMWSRILTTGSWQGEIWDRRKNGDDYPKWASIAAVKNSQGTITHYFSIFTDITERKKAEERIHYLAYYDPLTDLPNRSLVMKLIDQALAEARRNRLHGALLFVDLNRFKNINDTLGHAVGDRLLQQVAQRFRAALRTEDVVARIGGDEFIVALFDITRREHAGIVAQKLLGALDDPFLIEEHELRVSASIGISVYPQDGFDTDKLVRFADVAMYRAKQAGGGHLYYSLEMNQRSLERLQIEAGLRRALDRDELLLHYQPKVDALSGAITGGEVLVRWQHPEQGLVPPNNFIPVAEETGLIIRLGTWVLEAACAQARAWHDAGLAVPTLAINVSAREFSSHLPGRVAAVLARHRLPASQIELEITESMLMHSTDKVVEIMDAFRTMGVALALDDFGTGFSSLSYLKRFPIDTLKIDRSFVTDIPSDANDCAIAGAIVSMAKQLQHKVVAEGVETADQLAFLTSIGCHEYQGYLFSRPLPAAEFEALLRQGPISG